MQISGNRFISDIWRSLGGNEHYLDQVSFAGEGALPSVYSVTEFASAAIAAATLSVSELLCNHAQNFPEVIVDCRLASFWFGMSIRPIGWTMPAPWDPIAGDYQSEDGWIRLHTNAPHHRLAAESVLGKHANKESMSQAVVKWKGGELEKEIIAKGGCAAEMRSLAQWADHPQGRALTQESLIEVKETHREIKSYKWKPYSARPLKGLKVLDLTRVLAGPVATRFLAGYGADVLRIDPPDWDEPGVVPEVTLGKRCARLDLKTKEDRKIFESLLADTDILIHGYRADALEGLGYDESTRREISPGLIDVSLNSYGWTGPWRNRRGFDSLVQMSSGIAHAGMIWKGSPVPVPLPVQALDQATGYLMAAAAIRGIINKTARTARLSLARTALELVDAGQQSETNALLQENKNDISLDLENTSWGRAQRIQAPARIEGVKMYWERPASMLGSSSASWI